MGHHLRHDINDALHTRLTERAIYGTRLLLVPFYFGLIVGLFAYLVKFLQEAMKLVSTCWYGKDETIMLSVITMLDYAMIANFITLMTIGSYSTFVSKILFKEGVAKPQWLDHMSPGILKKQMAASLVGISSVGLLKVFVGRDDPVSAMQFNRMCIIHGMFILGALALFVMALKDFDHNAVHGTDTTETNHEHA